jgi:hypothetical protein
LRKLVILVHPRARRNAPVIPPLEQPLEGYVLRLRRGFFTVNVRLAQTRAAGTSKKRIGEENTPKPLTGFGLPVGKKKIRGFAPVRKLGGGRKERELRATSDGFFLCHSERSEESRLL